MSENKKGTLITFEGEVRWATIPPREPRGPSKDYVTDANRDDMTYSIEVQCSEERFKQLKRQGIPKLTELRGTGEKASVTEEDEKNGQTYIRLKAPRYKTNAKSLGNPYSYEPIKTFGVDGQPLEESVGNGSKAVVNAYLKPNPRGGVTLRLHSVRVTELVPYAGGELSAEEKKALGLNDVPETATKKDNETVDANDIF